MLENQWMQLFQATPPGARVLDLATGGGQVATWAAAAGRGFGVTGVDFADIPATRADAPGVTFLGNVGLESLPFAAASFDLVISQYGFEYADRQKAAAECARVLAPGGRGRFIMHHPQSALSQDYDARASVFRAALRDVDCLRPGRRMFELHGRNAAPAQLAEAETRFRAAVEKARARLQGGPAHAEAKTYVDYLAALAAEPARFDPRDALAKLDQVEELTGAWLLRYVAQTRAVLDAGGVESVRFRLERHGLTVAPAGTLTSETGALLAWTLDFARA